MRIYGNFIVIAKLQVKCLLPGELVSCGIAIRRNTAVQEEQMIHSIMDESRKNYAE